MSLRGVESRRDGSGTSRLCQITENSTSTKFWSPVLLRAAGMRNPLIKDAGTSCAKQAYSETADWPLRDLSRAVVCGSVRISSKKPSSLS